MSRLKRLIQEIHRRSLWQVLLVVLGPAASFALVFILVVFTLSGELPLVWDVTALGWVALGFSVWPALSAILLSTKTARHAMLHPGKT